METREWRFPDSVTRKAMTISGPWDDEPDKLQWEDPVTKLPCLIVRGPSGPLCGYVGVQQGHPFYHVEYGQRCSHCEDESNKGDYQWCEHSPDSVINVHGGLTFSGECDPREGDEGICHVAPGDDKVWWLGFDTAHAGDICPAHLRLYQETQAGELLVKFHQIAGREWESYKNVEYVKAEVRQLARQLGNTKALARKLKAKQK